MYVINFLNLRMDKILFCGWQRYPSADPYRETLEYLMVQDSDWKDRFVQFGNADCKTTDSTAALFQLLLRHPNLAIIFSYGLLSVSRFRFIPRRVIEELAEEDLYVPFSLCLYGKISSPDEFTKKQVAFIFLDYIRPASSKKSSDYFHKPHFTSKYLERNYDALFFLGDVPVIILPSGNVRGISSNASVVKEIERLQEARLVKACPVYLSDTPITRDTVLNIDVSGLSGIDQSAITGSVQQLVYDFIQFLNKMPDSIMDAEKSDDFHGIVPCQYLKIYASREADKCFNEEDCYPYFLSYCRELLTALKRFECFISEKYPDFSADMEKIVSQTTRMLTNIALDCEKAAVLKTALPEVTVPSEHTYSRLFYQTLKKQYEKHPESITRTDQGSGSEFQVDFDIFCNTFSAVARECGQDAISYKKVLKYCRDGKVPLIRPNFRHAASGKAREFYFLRNRRKVLLIPSDIFEKNVLMGQPHG